MWTTKIDFLILGQKSLNGRFIEKGGGVWEGDICKKRVYVGGPGGDDLCNFSIFSDSRRVIFIIDNSCKLCVSVYHFHVSISHPFVSSKNAKIRQFKQENFGWPNTIVMPFFVTNSIFAYI